MHAQGVPSIAEQIRLEDERSLRLDAELAQVEVDIANGTLIPKSVTQLKVKQRLDELQST